MESFQFRRVLRKTAGLVTRSIGPVLLVGTILAIVKRFLDYVVRLTFPAQDFLKAFLGLIARYIDPSDDFAEDVFEFVAQFMLSEEEVKELFKSAPTVLEKVPVGLMLWGGAVVLYGILYPLVFYGCGLVTVVKVAGGDSWPIAQAFRALFGRLGTLLLVKVLELVAMLLGFLCLVLPGILLYVRFYIADVKVFTSNSNALACLRQSSALSSKYMGRVAGQILVVKLVLGLLNTGFGALRERLSGSELLPTLAKRATKETLETIWQSIVTAIWGANMFAIDLELSGMPSPTPERKDTSVENEKTS